MSNVKIGRSTQSRRAQNFPTKPAQKRINEHLDVFRNKIENALDIDSVEAIIFKRVRAGRPCICAQHNVSMEDTETHGDFAGLNTINDGPAMRPATGSNRGVLIDAGDDGLFGEASYQKSTVPKEIEVGDIPVSNRDMGEKKVYHDEVFTDTDFAGDSVLCGICYGEGVIPAFESVNYSYNILTIHEAVEIYGYHLNRNELPAVFDRMDAHGYICFEVVVPKYFISAVASIRNNTEVYPASKTLYTSDNKRLTKAYIDAHRGRKMLVKVMNVDAVTHAVLMFKLNDYEIRANLSTENEVINYENEVTIGDMNLVLSNRSGSVRSEDFVVLPKRNLVLKINGAPRKSTADKSLWQWNLTTRAVQRSEPTARLFKHYPIY